MYLDPERVKALLGKTTTPTTTGGGLLSAPAASAPVSGASWMGLDASNPFLMYPDAAKYLARDLGYTGSVMDQTAERARQAQADAWRPGMDSFSSQDAADRPAAALDKGFSDFIASKGYTFAPSMQGREPATTVYDATGKQVGQYRTGDADSRMMQAAQVIIPAVVGAGFGGGIAAAGGLTGASAGAATGATSGAVSSGANGGNVLQGALMGGLLGGVGSYAKEAFAGAGGASGGYQPSWASGDIASSIPANEGALQLAGSSPLTMADMMQGMPDLSSYANAAGGIPSSIQPLTSFSAADLAGLNPGATPQSLLDSLDVSRIPTTGAVPTGYDALRAGEKYNAGQATGNIPKTVNMGDLGGTTATTGGLSGTLDVAEQSLRDTGAAVKDVASPVSDWMKANPTLGRLLFSGATSLLSASGSGTGGSASSGVGSLAGSNGPAKQWSSPIQQGLLSPVKQYTPAPITQLQPQGLLAQGQVADGAWRFFGNRG